MGREDENSGVKRTRAKAKEEAKSMKWIFGLFCKWLFVVVDVVNNTRGRGSIPCMSALVLMLHIRLLEQPKSCLDY